MTANPKSGKKLRVTLLKSPFGTGARHMATVRGLGLRRLHHVVELQDTPAVRGMIERVAYLVRLES